MVQDIANSVKHCFKVADRKIKNIFIKLQLGTNIMVNEVKTPIQNYFEKVLYENLTPTKIQDQRDISQ